MKNKIITKILLIFDFLLSLLQTEPSPTPHEEQFYRKWFDEMYEKYK